MARDKSTPTRTKKQSLGEQLARLLDPTPQGIKGAHII
jgi:hypothetical protein